MGRGDNRRTKKSKQRRRWRAKKAKLRRRMNVSSPATKKTRKGR